MHRLSDTRSSLPNLFIMKFGVSDAALFTLDSRLLLTRIDEVTYAYKLDKG